MCFKVDKLLNIFIQTILLSLAMPILFVKWTRKNQFDFVLLFFSFLIYHIFDKQWSRKCI